MTCRHFFTFGALLGAILVSSSAMALDYPHAEENGFNCLDCHVLVQPPDATPTPPPDDIDDTKANNICWSCHDDSTAVYVGTHSSLTTSDKYGDADGDGQPGWSMQCKICHDPHRQAQFRDWDDESYLVTGTSTDVSSTTLSMAGATWEENAFVGYYLIPNTSSIDHNPIISNTVDTLTVSGSIDLSQVNAGDTFAIVYAKLIRSHIRTPNSGYREVKFFRTSGANSFADGDSNYDGVCEVCHTQTTHFRTDGSGSDQLHTNVDGAGTNCITCHNHRNGFAHGGGAGAGCEPCHGHDAGYEYSPGEYSQGVGTTISHSTHTENDADDLKGPNVGCDACHDTANFPSFKSGTDSNGDGRISLDETDVCDTCHSPNGTYDGVNDPDLGAKNNWSSGVYSGFNLVDGKEKWCATCHDESPSVISEIPAPNVVGDEDAESTYGLGYGYYKTGHGLGSSESYPESGGVVSGAGLGCDGCHDYSVGHIDGVARSFDCVSGCDPSTYRSGYRLKLVDGLNPMYIPLPQNTNPLNGAEQFRLCYSCHDTGPYLSSSNMNTNMVTDGVNRHEYHLNLNQIRWPADWGITNNSRITCVSCHNVHGSTQLVMVRDGMLMGREPGLVIWYNNDDLVSYATNSTNPPNPEDLPLSASTGTVWRGATSANLCSHCHNNNNVVPEYRAPFQDVSRAPTLSWCGETGYEMDGVDPDFGSAGDDFIFRVQYADENNDAPTTTQVWIDRNDDGDFDDTNEKVDMQEVNPSDTSYIDGKRYSATVSLAKAGDDVIEYRFYATDGLEATGEPTGSQSVSLVNTAPVLSWTGESNFITDGVDPDNGGSGSSFEFRILYQDDDGECPPSGSDIQLWLDENDDGLYQEGEKHAMSAADANPCATGRIFSYSITLSETGDGQLNYTFRASDGFEDASSDAGPLSDNVVTVSAGGTPPTLAWTSAACLSEGVRPSTGAGGADFEFLVNFTDSGNACPASGSSDIQVWVDVGDNGYDAGDMYNLSEVDSGDTDCTDGKLYAVTLLLNTAGAHNYRFYASNGSADAVGTPTSDAAVTVVGALKVRPEGGSGWQTTIQGALNATLEGEPVYVYPNADFSAATYSESVFVGNYKHNRTLKAVCGADLTTISGSSYAVMTQNSNYVTIDGFSLTSAGRGVYVNIGTPITIENCKIHNNATDGVFSQNTNTILMDNCELFENTGPAIDLRAGSDHQISNTYIHDNTATNGAGTFVQGSFTATFTDCIFENNNATYGGAVYPNAGATPVFQRTLFVGNTAGTGAAVYVGSSSVGLTFENSILIKNVVSGTTSGGALYLNGGWANFTNCTIADNSTGGNGGAMFIQNNTVNIYNSILWNNSAGGSGQIAYFNNGTLNIYDSVISNDGDGDFSDAPYFTGNRVPTLSGYASEGDPNFKDTVSNDYHIQPSSSAIDQANSSYAPADDFDGDSRPSGSEDIGADEYLP